MYEEWMVEFGNGAFGGFKSREAAERLAAKIWAYGFQPGRILRLGGVKYVEADHD